MAKRNRAGKGTFAQRVGTFFLCALLTLFFIWLLDFLRDDVGNIEGPDRDTFYAELDQAPEELLKDLRRQQAEVTRQVQRKQGSQGDYKASMENARQVMQGMVDLKRLSIEQGVVFPPSDQEALAAATARFIAAQKQFETANGEITALNFQSYDLEDQIREQVVVVTDHRRPADELFEDAEETHELKTGFYKLAIQLPLFLLAAWLVSSRKQSPYRPIYLAALVATFWEVSVIAWEHFDREYFKYIAIITAIVITLGFLRYILANASKPPMELLLRRYRASYERCRCPICDFSLRRGSLREAVWTRKGPLTTAAAAPTDAEERPYTCPSCGTILFDSCNECQKIRHSLLPSCENCGAEHATEGAS
ncbi:MAG TPA: hypothetical protein EYN79_09580 [Planctomycetes bacterium]|nr:hypothetical protein [Planctomycetota bacterium]HIN79984.1 hypothetical protein [Planctomycetota bacterium]